MSDEQGVVIVGKDGTEHHFPAGMDPQKAAAIVRGDAMEMPAQDLGTGRKNLMDTFSMPIDKTTGKPFRAKAFAPPRGVVAPLAGMGAALATGGLSIPLQAAITALVGAGAEGVDAKMHGEELDPTSMAVAGGTQAAFTGAGPTVAKWTGNAASQAGQLMQKFRPKIGGRLGIMGAVEAAAHAAGVPPIVAGSVAQAVVPPTVRGAGRVVEGVGNGLMDAATAKAVQGMGRTADGVVPAIERIVPGSRVSAVPDALRKLQILYRALTAAPLRDAADEPQAAMLSHQTVPMVPSGDASMASKRKLPAGAIIPAPWR